MGNGHGVCNPDFKGGAEMKHRTSYKPVADLYGNISSECYKCMADPHNCRNTACSAHSGDKHEKRYQELMSAVIGGLD